jgi:dynein assembly factor 1
VVRKISQYRKNIICLLRGLTYLDDRPVFDDERRLAHAWQLGGRDGEKAEREAIRLEKLAKDESNRQAFQLMIDASRARRAAEDPELVLFVLHHVHICSFLLISIGTYS